MLITSVSLTILRAEHGPIINPSDAAILITENAMSLTTTDLELESILELVAFSESDEQLDLKSDLTIEFIQLLNAEGDLEFQMPIMSNSVHLALTNFDSGIYQMKFLFEGTETFKTSTLTIK